MISMASAPRGVLRALVEDEEQGARLADRIIAARERKKLDRDELMNQLRRSGLADDEIARVIAIATFDPALWRINVMSEDRKHNTQRYFVMQAELVASILSVRSWEELIGTDPSDPFAEKASKSDREEGDSADLNDDGESDDNGDEPDDDRSSDDSSRTSNKR